MQLAGVLKYESLIKLNYRRYDGENQSFNFQNSCLSIAEV